jgi:hypothetical protein
MPKPMMKIRDEKDLQDSSPIITSTKRYLQHNQFLLQLVSNIINNNHGSESTPYIQNEEKICESDMDVSDEEVEVYFKE